MIEVTDKERNWHIPNIYVVGIGGGGNNAVNRMIEAEVENVNFLCVNTDYQILESCKTENILQIGAKLTGGYGAGTDPSIGEAAARENEEEIKNCLKDANMVLLTCGMGGGTGTGAISVIAKICKEMGILTIAVVTLPFEFEGKPRSLVAKNGIETLKGQVDTLLIIPNDKLLKLSDKPFFIDEAFVMADNVLKWTIQGITNIVINKGIINLDFNDLRKLFRDKGIAYLGIGIADDGCSIQNAVMQAIDSPLLDTNIEGASTVLINTSGRINIAELHEAISYVRSITGENSDINWGTVTDPKQISDEKVIVTLIATGLPEKKVSTVVSDESIKILEMTNDSKQMLRKPQMLKKSLEVPEFLKRYNP